MSKKELYAWSSLASSLVLVGFYVIAAFGWPESLESYEAYVTDIFWKVLGVAITIEIILELLQYFKVGEVDKDERDVQIASKGYRNAYYFVMVALIALVFNVLVSDFISKSTGNEVFLAAPFLTVHILVVIVFTAHILKSVTQLYYYNKF